MEGFWITPGDARAEQDTVNTAVHQLDADIKASAAPALASSWALFRAEWDAFYEESGGLFGWMGRFLTAGAYEKTQDYRRQLEAWRVRFESQGGQSSAPGLVPVPVSQAAETMRYVMISVAILGGLWVAHTIYKETKGRTA